MNFQSSGDKSKWVNCSNNTMMFSVAWAFIGSLVGILLVAVFKPPARKNPQVPLPGMNKSLHTKSGCVKFRSEEVPCTNESTSLNLLASQHK